MAKKKINNIVESPFKMVLPEKMKVGKDRLRMGLYFYHEAIVMQIFDDKGGAFRVISPQDLSKALTRDITFSSGLLPENTLWWSQKKSGQFVALWVEPGIRKLALQATTNSRPERYTIPLPGLIFICQPARAPWVYAASKKPVGLKDRIYKAPFPNIYPNGNTCGGSNKYPADIAQVPDSFFRSFFTNHLGNGISKRYPGNILQLWKELEGKKEYPVSDLNYHGTVKDLMEMQL